MKSLFALVLVLWLSGCAVWTHHPESATVADPSGRFSIQVPAGWVRNNLASDQILITRDGPHTQQIALARHDFDKAFPKLKKKVDAKTLPTELAELTIAEMKNHDFMANLSVVENQPARLGTLLGFRLHVRFKTQAGLKVDRLTYGAVGERCVFMLSYTAPQLHYFERDLPVFERVVGSFKIL